jgi:flagellar protein FlaJ
MFREFIENLVPMVEGGSNVHQYFSIKMDQYFANAKKSQELFIKTLELICEVYIVAFVAVPIFLLVTLVSIGMMNSSQAPYIFQAIYIGLPVGSMALIFIIDTISPKEDLGMKYEEKKVVKKAGFIWEEDLDDKEYSKMVSEFTKRKSIQKLVGVLKNPFVPIYKEPLRAFYISIPLMLIPFLFLNVAFDKQLLLSLVILMFPPSIAYEYKMRKLAKLDRSIPDFLRRLGEINEVGLTLQSAISLLLKSDIGVLSGEVKRVWLGLEWGNEMKDALTRFENRVGTPSLRRAVTLLVKASEVSDDTKDVLMIAAEDADNMVSLRKQRFETGFVYMSTVYIAFFTFIYVCYSFSMEFLPPMSKLGTGSLVNVSQINSTMFSTCSILGFFSGIMTGQMAEGRVMFGLKHAILFLLLTYLSFTMFMEY